MVGIDRHGIAVVTTERAPASPPQVIGREGREWYREGRVVIEPAS